MYSILYCTRPLRLQLEELGAGHGLASHAEELGDLEVEALGRLRKERERERTQSETVQT